MGKKKYEIQGLMSQLHLSYDILKDIPGDVYWKDTQGKWLGLNNSSLQKLKRFSKINGFSDVVGKTDFELFQPDVAQFFRDNDAKVIETRKKLVVEELQYDANGKKVYQLSTKVPIMNSNQEVIAIVGSTVDITELKLLEANLKKANLRVNAANEAKSEFIANMSHDIRLPITGMLGMSEGVLSIARQAKAQLQDENIDIQELRSMMLSICNRIEADGDMLKVSTESLLNLCNNILTVVRLEKGMEEPKRHAFDPHKTLQQVIDIMRPTANIKQLVLHYTEKASFPAYIKSIELYVERILLSLISNALKFTHHGKVEVTVWVEQQEQVMLYMQVKDSGIGIKAEDQDKIFVSFARLSSSYQGEYDGVGIGLYAVDRYLQVLNGSIEVTSEPGKGSEFVVSIPIEIVDASEIIQHVTVGKNAEAEIGSKVRVLIIEDNHIALTVIKRIIENYGCDVDDAQTGQEALEKIKSEDYDLILMDIGLADISGIDVTKQIVSLPEKSKACIPIVGVSGHADNQALCEQAIGAGMQAVLDKPLTLNVFKKILDDYILKD